MPATIVQMISTTTKMSLLKLQKDTISPSSLGSRLFQFPHCAQRMVVLVVVELGHWDEVLCYLCQTLHMIALDFDHVGSSGRSDLNC